MRCVPLTRESVASSVCTGCQIIDVNVDLQFILVVICYYHTLYLKLGAHLMIDINASKWP